MWTLVQVAIVSFGLWTIHRTLPVMQELMGDQTGSLVAITMGGMPIVCLGVGWTAMSQYAMYRLLRIIREKDEETAEQRRP
jgi:uncharacterized membrane protein YidH (DUF202 family)